MAENKTKVRLNPGIKLSQILIHSARDVRMDRNDKVAIISHLRMIHFSMLLICGSFLIAVGYFPSVETRDSLTIVQKLVERIPEFVDPKNVMRAHVAAAHDLHFFGESRLTVQALNQAMQDQQDSSDIASLLSSMRNPAYWEQSVGNPFALSRRMFRTLVSVEMAGSESVEIGQVDFPLDETVQGYSIVQLDCFARDHPDMPSSLPAWQGSKNQWQPEQGLGAIGVSELPSLVENIRDLYSIRIHRCSGPGSEIYEDLFYLDYLEETLRLSEEQIDSAVDLFMELNEQEGLEESLVEQIQSIRSSIQSRASRIEVMGLSIPGELLSKWGSMIILIIQSYFLLHIRESISRMPIEGIRDSVWIGLYDSLFSRLVCVSSLVLFPVYVFWLLATNFAYESKTDSAIYIATIGVAASIFLAWMILKDWSVLRRMVTK